MESGGTVVVEDVEGSDVVVEGSVVVVVVEVVVDVVVDVVVSSGSVVVVVVVVVVWHGFGQFSGQSLFAWIMDGVRRVSNTPKSTPPAALAFIVYLSIVETVTRRS